MTATPEERDGARIHDIEIDGTEAFLVEPIDGGRGPAVLFLHWLDSEAPDGNRTQFLDEAAGLARGRGVVSLLPQGRFPWTAPPSDAESDVGRISAELDGLRAGVDLLAARSDVDGTRIALVGHDYGAMHGLILASEDERIAGAVLIALVPRWGDWNLAFFPVAGDRYDYLRALEPYDAVSRIGALAPRPVWLQMGADDFYVAPMDGWELHRAAGAPKEVHTYAGADHAMRVIEARQDREGFIGSIFGWSEATDA